MKLNFLNVWRNQDDALAALRAANALHYGETLTKPFHISDARWRGMITYFITRIAED